ncbi:MAG: deoxyuridine triphosphatase [Candidatus Westeberhardia cardiocondylae]|nr:deoxyuridine triphosphatase [Candidatus Westeberhardia cardiocondylae]
MKININIKITNKNIPYPKYTTTGSSALDLHANINKPIQIKPKNTVLIPTGIAIHISDPNITAIIIPRSGLGHYHGIILGNTIGLIDSDYQGEIKLSIWNRNNKTYTIQPHERIAQIIFFPIIRVKFNLIKSFKNRTKRNNKGFGHSGKI